MTRRTTLGQLYRDQAHLEQPEPRWRWWVGFVGELAVLLFVVVAVLAIMAVQS